MISWRAAGEGWEGWEDWILGDGVVREVGAVWVVVVVGVVEVSLRLMTGVGDVGSVGLASDVVGDGVVLVGMVIVVSMDGSLARWRTRR